MSVHRLPWWSVVMVSGNGGREARPAVHRSTCTENQRFNRLAVWFSVCVCCVSWLCVVGCRPWNVGAVAGSLPVRCLVPVSVHRWPLWSVQSGTVEKQNKKIIILTKIQGKKQRIENFYRIKMLLFRLILLMCLKINKLQSTKC